MRRAGGPAARGAAAVRAEGGLGRRKQTAGRLRSKELLENRSDPFGRTMYEARRAVERFFGNLTNWWAGLTHLPPWARGYRRVHRWVQAKLVVGALKTKLLNATCAAS
ncbi:MAG: hypothetical protein ACRDD1_09395 [Planctomycetia bacterium]